MEKNTLRLNHEKSLLLSYVYYCEDQTAAEKVFMTLMLVYFEQMLK